MESLETFHQNRRVIEAFTRRSLATIPTQLGRILYVANRRDPAAGVYRHPDLEASFPPGSVHDALAYCHRELFDRILELPLDELEKDLRRFLEDKSGARPEQTARLWLEEKTYRHLAPPGVPVYLNYLWESNMRVVLRLAVGDQPSPSPTP
jgi:hypothetical protein